MDRKIFVKTEKFLKQRFIKYPHWSFNNWRVMYEHSIDVKNIALKLAKKIKCDPTIAGISALLHDIGKTYKTSEKNLEINAHTLNAIVARTFLKGSGLPKNKIRKILTILSYKSRAVEYKIMTDADALAFFKDKRLHSLYFEWALKKQKRQNLKRHLKKFDQLHFPESKKIGTKWFKKMLKEWNPKLKSLT